MASTSLLHHARRESLTTQDHEVSSHPEVEEAEVDNDNEEESGEEGDSTRFPLSGAVAAVQTMANVGRLMVLHDELDSGHASVYQQRRKLTVANDDYEDLNNNNLSYVRRVYSAITTTPASMDNEQSKMAEVLAKKLKTFGGDADQYLGDISSMVVGAVYHLHSDGDFLFGPQFELLKPRKADSTMTATERIDALDAVADGLATPARASAARCDAGRMRCPRPARRATPDGRRRSGRRRGNCPAPSHPRPRRCAIARSATGRARRGSRNETHPALRKAMPPARSRGASR